MQPETNKLWHTICSALWIWCPLIMCLQMEDDVTTCDSYCGWHDSNSFRSKQYPFAVVFDPSVQCRSAPRCLNNLGNFRWELLTMHCPGPRLNTLGLLSLDHSMGSGLPPD